MRRKQPRKYTARMILALGSGTGNTAWAWLALPSAVALLAYAVAALPGNAAALRSSVVVAWLAHAVAIVVDAIGAGAPPGAARFGFAPALSVTLWLVIAVYLVESRFLPQDGVRRVLSLLGAIAVVLALIFPGELRPQALSRWTPLHWVMGIASYGLFGAAVLHAALLNRTDRQMRAATRGQAPRTAGLPLMRLERLTFQFVAAGFAVLTGALVLGWYFTESWKWDHKTVFSMLGWGVFASLLAGRRFFGWRGRYATRWVYAGAALLLLGYVGSRFVLEVVLHRPVPA